VIREQGIFQQAQGVLAQSRFVIAIEQGKEAAAAGEAVAGGIG